MCNIFVQGIVVDQRKKIYDVVYMIETERIRRANEGLYEYKQHIDHVWIDLQAREVELYKGERKELTCPNYESSA